MSDELSRRHAFAWLQHHKFDVSPTPLMRSKSADLTASWGAEVYAIEAKGKKPSLFWRELAETSSVARVAHGDRLVESNNAISAIISEASEQLAATPLPDSAFRIIWILAAHDDSAFILECFEKRLFGSVDLACLKGMLDELSVRPCYYYEASDFWRYPSLDAAVLAGPESGWLCMNSFSPRREALRQSRLYSVFKEHRAIRDPELAEQSGEALIITEVIEHGSQGTYLFQRYGLRTNVMLNSQFLGFLTMRQPFRIGGHT